MKKKYNKNERKKIALKIAQIIKPTGNYSQLKAGGLTIASKLITMHTKNEEIE